MSKSNISDFTSKKYNVQWNLTRKHETEKVTNKKFLKCLDMLTVAQKQNTKKLNKIEAFKVIDINGTAELNMNKISTKFHFQPFSTTYSKKTKTWKTPHIPFPKNYR